MKRIVAGIASLAVVVGGLAGIAPAAHASTTYVYNGSFSMNDGVPSETATITVTDLKATDGSLVSGGVTVDMVVSGTTICTMHERINGFSGSRVNVGMGGCAGWIDFGGVGTSSLSVSDVWLRHDFTPLLIFTGAASGSATGVAQKPVPVDFTGCTATLDDAAQTVSILQSGSHPDPSTVVYKMTINGVEFDMGPGVEVDADYMYLTPGPFSATIEARNANGDNLGRCITNTVTIPYPRPGAPTIDSVVTAVGGLLTVNYSVASPATVQGIEYQLDGTGSWIRPGGTAPVAGSGGSFSVSGLKDGKHSVTLRTVGLDSVQTTEGTAKSFVIPAATTPKPGTTNNQAVAAGSSPTKPVAAPPAQPVSTVSGTSNGAGSGTNGALAANTGEAGIDAPCLAKNGTLYPNLYSTVGSQLTMVPNTTGMAEPKAFTVVAGALPPGIMLDRMVGVVYGVPTQQGSWVTTVEAKFADGSTKTGQFTTRIDNDPETLQYSPLNLGIVGQPTSIAATTNAPATGTSYRIVCGKLPAGTKLNQRTGQITGTPTETDVLPTPLRIAETSATGKAAASFIFIVADEGQTTVTYPAHPHLRVHKIARIRPTLHGVGAANTFRMWKGKLPKGLHLNHTTGVITGKPRNAGRTHTITIVAVTTGGALLTSNPMKIKVRR